MVVDYAPCHSTAIPMENNNRRRIEQHTGSVFGSTSISSEWFDLVSCGRGPLAAVIPEALLAITQ